MATFSNIDVEEPSTVTFTVAAVSVTRNSSAELQEILTLGDAETTNGLARVLNAAPVSTEFALAVRIAGGPSSVADLAVRAVLPSTAADNLVRPIAPSTYGDGGIFRVAQSTAGDLNVTVAGYSTIVAASLTSPLSTAAPATDASGLVVRQVGYSTTVNISSLGGAVVVRSSAADALVTAHGNQSSNSSVYLPVRLTNGTAFLQTGADYTHGSTVSTISTALTAPGLMLRAGTDALSNTNLFTLLRGSTAGAALVSLGTDSGASAVGSTNGALKVNVVAGSAAGDTTVTASFAAGYVSSAAPAAGSSGLVVRQVGYSTTLNVSSLAGAVITRSSAADQLVTVYQSTAADLNVTVAGYSTIMAVSSVDGLVNTRPVSSSGVSLSTDTDPASTVQGLIVRQVGFSTMVAVSSLAGAVDVRPVAGSTFTVRAMQSSAADLNVTVAGYSTTVNVSSVGGAVVVRSSAADFFATVKNSTIGELLASVQQNSTVWQTQAKIQDSSGVGFIGTITRPTTAVQGLAVRTVLNDLQSTYLSTMGNNSTSSTIVSSVAAQRVKVFAYSITSTVQAINTLSFASSLANPIWGVQMQSVSSAIAGANLAVTPPAWLFATEAASPLVFKVTGTTGTYHLALSYFSEA